MTQSLILAIDQGTTNSKAALVSVAGDIVASASRPMDVSHPQPGWAELDANDIWQTVRLTIDELVDALTGGKVIEKDNAEIAAIAIANQRESIVLWDAQSGEALTPCVIWQCRRSSDICAGLKAEGYENRIAELSGLGIDPLFPAAKIAWLLDNTAGLRQRAEAGEVKAGTVDSWLLWQLTAGATHATDTSNASRTQLMNLQTQQWDEELAGLFNVPLKLMPKICASDTLFGTTAGGVTQLSAGIPVHAVLGDSHAALYGHGIREPGQVKVTLGTGSSLMTLTNEPTLSRHGLSGTMAWTVGNKPFHALEGNIAVSGQAAAFAVELLNLTNEKALTELAQSVESSGDVVFIPALAGLGAPHWVDSARGRIVGMSLGTKPAHIARATLEAIALQINDVIEAIEADLGIQLDSLSVDGGAAASDVLLQLMADLLNRNIIRPRATEMTTLGVARLATQAAGLGSGSRNEDQGKENADEFYPALDASERDRILSNWKAALEELTT